MSFRNQKITTALLLAAGMGTRLHPLTRNAPKCLTHVNGVTILERLVSGLVLNGFKRLIVVTGHLDHCITSFLEPYAQAMDISYVYADQYKTTNNICSLWKARHAVTEPFVLIESDLVFEPKCLASLQAPDRIAVAEVAPWMNGTMVTINRNQKVGRFLEDGEPSGRGHGSHSHQYESEPYKTVNMYSLSGESWKMVKQELDAAVQSGYTQTYYESVFKALVARKKLELTPVFFDNFAWYEIDTIQDLAEAEKIFSGLSSDAIAPNTPPDTLPGAWKLESPGQPLASAPTHSAKN